MDLFQTWKSSSKDDTNLPSEDLGQLVGQWNKTVNVEHVNPYVIVLGPITMHCVLPLSSDTTSQED